MLIWINSPEPVSDRFVFLDRDGIINEDSPSYIKDRREFKFYDESLEALRRLHENRVNVIVISNQSGLNRGIITRNDFWEMHDYMVRGIREAGGEILAALYCPHRPDENCACRKPSPAMILAASRLFGIPLSESTYMVGDNLKDIQAAQGAGCSGILVERRSSDGLALDSPKNIKAFERYPTFTQAVLSLLETHKAC